MNIFRLDDNPRLAARYHCDQHVSKMLLEAVQICNTALVKQGLEEHAFYSKTHASHPTVEWVTESGGNFAYALRLIHGLNDEKCARYDSGDHSSYEKVCDEWFDGECTLPLDFSETQTEQPLAAGDYESTAESSVERYRDYYRDVKREQEWFGYEKEREPPDWLHKD